MVDAYFVRGKKRSSQGNMSNQRRSLSRTRPTATRAPTYMYMVSNCLVKKYGFGRSPRRTRRQGELRGVRQEWAESSREWGRVKSL